MQSVWQDVRYAIRGLWQRPGFTAIAIITLTLGIGANTAIFSIINTVLLKPLPYESVNRLVVIWTSLKRADQVELSPNTFSAIREGARMFSEIAASERVNLNLTGAGNPVRLEGQAATANLFPVLGIQPLLGRTFSVEEDRANARVAVLSNSLWQSRLGGSKEVVGSIVQLDGKAFEVIGVMPNHFQFPPPGRGAPAEVWIPRSLETEKRRDAHNLLTIGQLKDGTTFDQARAEMDGLVSNWLQADPRRQGTGINLVPLHSQVSRKIRPSLLVLSGAVGFILLIACANVANLLLASATARRKEIALRFALGASRWRVVRQLLTESVLLSTLGGSFGLLLAVWGSEAIRVLGAGQIPRADEISIDTTVFAFTLALSLLTGIVFGAAPALYASRANINEVLKEGGRSSTSGDRHRLRRVLVIAEVSLSVVLLLGAGLFIKGFWQLVNVDPGFATEKLLTVELSLTADRYAAMHSRTAFYERLLDRVATSPGVQSAAIVNHPPFSGRRGIGAFQIEGKPAPTGMENTPLADFRVVSPGYFEMLRIPIVEGRTFADSDGSWTQRVTIVNRAFAERYWPGENPIGMRLRGDQEWLTVVGIAGDIRQSGLDEEAAPHVYAPYQQGALLRTGLIVRTTTDPATLVPAIQKAVNAIDPDLPIYNVRTMDESIAMSVSDRRVNLVLLSVFAITALLLAAAGIYGVVSYSVTQRVQEIGIRMALGAQRQDIVRLIVGEGMLPVALGLAVGIAGALVLTRVLGSLLAGISTNDPTMFVVISVVLGIVALLACSVPALRATRIDPMVAVRLE